jgi:hypothetical protein
MRPSFPPRACYSSSLLLRTHSSLSSSSNQLFRRAASLIVARASCAGPPCPSLSSRLPLLLQKQSARGRISQLVLPPRRRPFSDGFPSKHSFQLRRHCFSSPSLEFRRKRHFVQMRGNEQTNKNNDRKGNTVRSRTATAKWAVGEKGRVERGEDGKELTGSSRALFPS